MRYLITGGTGFIGAYVVRQLLDAGGEASTFDLAPDIDYLADLLGERQAAAVNVIEGDVTDLPALSRAMRDTGAQRVIHLASLLGELSNKQPLRALKVNSEGTINIFEAALENKVERVAWASSVGVFGLASKRPPGAMANDALHRPTDIYGACKTLNERFAKHYRRAFGLDNVGLRYVAVYGYGKSRTLSRGTGAPFMTELIDNPANDLPGRVPAGDAIIDFVHVEDAARATVLAANGAPCEPIALNIGGFRTTLRGAADIVRGILPEADLVVEDGSWNGVDHHYDLSAAESAIGYTPRIDLATGLRENIEQIRKRRGR